MRTEQDLRAALTVRETLAPEPETVLADARQIAAQHRRRRATGTAATVILAVAAVITVPVLLLQGSPVDPGPAPVANSPTSTPTPSPTAATTDPNAATRRPFAFTIEPVSVAGFEILPSGVSADGQNATIWAAGGGAPVARIVVHAPGSRAGSLSAQAVVDGEPVSVHGTLGWYKHAATDIAVLVWEYAPEAFAAIRTDEDAPPLAKDVMRSLAEALLFVPPYPAKVPYRLDFFPADLTQLSIGKHTGPTEFSRSTVQALSRDENRPRGMDITIFEGPPRANTLWYGGYPNWDWEPATIAGRPARCAGLVDGRRCEIDFGEFTLSMGVSDLTPDELDRLVAGMHFATVDDPTTWYDIDTAIPGL